MNSIVLTTSLPQSRVLAGEGFPVRLTLQNQGNQPTQAPHPDSLAPFTFRLLNSAGQAVHEFSRSRYRLALNPNPGRNPQPVSQVVEPGAKLHYELDFANVVTEVVPPGAYRLAVSCRLADRAVDASPVPITFDPPRLRAVTASVTDLGGVLAAALLHEPAEARSAVYQWESAPGNPLLGTARLRAEPAGTIKQVAIAVETRPARGGRWLAWSDGQNLSAALGWDRSLERTAGPFALELAQAQLLSPGLALEDRRAAFFVTGRLGADTVLRQILFRGTVAQKPFSPDPDGPVPPAEPEEPDQPEFQNYSLGSHPVASLLIRYFSEQTDRLQLVGSDTQGDARRIVSLSITRGDPARREFNPLYQRNEPLAALALPPVQIAGQGYVDALFGPAGEEKKMTLARIPLDQPGAATEWSFFLKDLAPAGAPSPHPQIARWILCSGVTPTPPVLALRDDQLWQGWPGTTPPAWAPLLNKVEPTASVQLLAFAQPDRYRRTTFAFVTSPTHGILTLPLRQQP